MAKKTRAGDLKHIVTIQRKAESQDSQGGEIDVWVNILVTRASINPVTGRELYLDNHILNDVDQIIGMRFTDIIPADRIIFGGRIFDVKKALDDEERKHRLTILARERLTEKYVSASVPRITEDGEERITEDGNVRMTEG